MNLNNSKIHRSVNFIVAILSVILVLMYYHPVFLRVNVDTTGSLLSRYVLVATCIFFLLNINLPCWEQSKFVRHYIVYLCVIALIGGALMISHSGSSYFHQVRMLGMALMFYLIGISSSFSKKQYKVLCFVFIAFSIFMGISQVLINIGSFVILAQYLASAKNCISGLFSIGIVLCWAFFLSDNETKEWKVISLICMIMLAMVLITVRGRSGMLASFCTCGMMFLVWIKRHNVARNNAAFFMLAALTILGIFVFWHFFVRIGDYIFASLFTANSMGDVTSGRMVRNREAVELIMKAPLLGKMAFNDGYEIGWVHNYFLLTLSNYGLVFGGIVIGLYFYLIKVVWRGCKHTIAFDESNHGYWVMVIMLIISFFEPTYPYGPGTVAFFPFFLLGNSMQRVDKQ